MWGQRQMQQRISLMFFAQFFMIVDLLAILTDLLYRFTLTAVLSQNECEIDPMQDHFSRRECSILGLKCVQ
jgi:hypothetical protein